MPTKHVQEALTDTEFALIGRFRELVLMLGRFRELVLMLANSEARYYKTLEIQYTTS